PAGLPVWAWGIRDGPFRAPASLPEPERTVAGSGRQLPAIDTLDHHGGGTRAYLRACRRGLRGVIAVGPVGGVLDVDEHRAVVRGEGEAGNFTAIGADEEAPQLPLGLHIER